MLRSRAIVVGKNNQEGAMRIALPTALFAAALACAVSAHAQSYPPR